MQTSSLLASSFAAASASFSRPHFVPFTINSRFKDSPQSKSRSLRLGLCVESKRRYSAIKASSSSDSLRPTTSIAPLQLESPTGQFLSQILTSHPHLVPAAVEQQLEQLQIDRDAEKQKEATCTTGTDLVLYRRIAELKHNERKKALEEILYALIVQKFMDADVSLVPAISAQSSDPSGRVDTWPCQDEKLEKIHSHEANEMIQNHLTFILGNRSSDPSSVAQVSKLKVGQVYAASVMYGYFLKRIDQRFQLEKTMKILPGGSAEERNIEQVIGDETRPNVKNIGDSSRNLQPHPEVSAWSGGLGLGGIGEGIRSSRLKTYVMSFDAETLQRYATIRSKEAIDIVEKHTEALFGKPEIVISPEGRVDSSKDENIKISLGGLKRLVLEAVTFGAFLWDVESHVDSRYHFVAN
ncbi:UV-B-induced protein At3g17800, chloroplastic isoform X2 [Daucus carota subsp. sativus]|uniref:UV-B-induced protein At3g17800, chloroplastic isoform X2 n=1 Tax=Daucus carota subsp. sativus TaxID=79200 RepID=UPI0007B1FF70|nr:PREDICTED: UV-B-induced protein At3g17800, chloroplastic-like isoform X2 [Daucus carota subsp. sativus]